MTNKRTKPCPKCGCDAINAPVIGESHMGHVLHQGTHSGNPLLIGLSVLAAGVTAVKHHWFCCRSCGHRFFSW
jgi:hypothetical protein